MSSTHRSISRKRVERAAAPFLDGIGRLIGGEHAERGDLRLAVLVDVARLERALAREERGLGVDDLAHQRAAFVAVDDVGFEERQPSLQAVQQRVAFGAGRQALQSRQMVARRASFAGSAMNSL